MLITQLPLPIKIMLAAGAFVAMAASIFLGTHPLNNLLKREQSKAPTSAPAATPVAQASPQPCNQGQKNIYTNQYNNKVSEENNRHSQKVTTIGITAYTTAPKSRLLLTKKALPTPPIWPIYSINTKQICTKLAAN